jgi:Ser/Thr protein kinase RdoA (MazF antagonist)
MQIPSSVQSTWHHCFLGSTCQQAAGGLSSSKVWHIHTSFEQDFCLKAWPEDAISDRRLLELQRFSALLSDQLDYVPRLVPPTTSTQSLTTPGVAHHAGYFWEMSQWMPGEPLPADQVTLQQGIAAVEAVGKIHRISRSIKSMVAASPSVAIRLEALSSYRSRVKSLGQLVGGPECGELVRQTMVYFQRSVDELIAQLKTLEPVELFWVIRDVHREHILFRETKVSGIIDFGAARLDEPLIDMVRLLGSLCPLDCSMRHELLRHYCEAMQSPLSLARFRVLDRASTLLSSMQWLQWIGVENRQFSVDRKQLLQRWQGLNQRLDQDHW